MYLNVQYVQSKCIKKGNKNTEIYMINNYRSFFSDCLCLSKIVFRIQMSFSLNFSFTCSMPLVIFSNINLIIFGFIITLCYFINN